MSVRPIFDTRLSLCHGLQNTAGSFSLLSATLPSDATVASKLRAAGAIILGKSNLSQWANFRASNVSNGWSAYGGQTVGAYYPSQDPCGSSSGSGVATSLGLAWAALGTETDGSLICPGQFNNIVSIKPTVGLTSRHFVIPISATQDTVGPMARTVEDAAALLGVIAGADSADNATLANPHAYNTPDYVRAAKSGTLKGKRFGVPRNWINVNSQGDPSAAPLLAAFEASLDVLRTAGASVVDSNFTILNDPSNLQTLSNNEDLVLATEFIAGLASYLASLTKNPLGLTDLEQVRHFTQAFPAEDYPDINTAVWDQALAYNLSASSAPVYAAREQNFGFGATGGIQASIERDRLDAVVLPSAYASTPAAVVGSPVLTVPMGAYPNGTAIVKDERGVLVDVAPGIPFGVAFAGKKWSEEKLVGFAYAYEQRTHWRYRLKPIVRPTTELLGR